MRIVPTTLIFLFAISVARAEYRVFELAITNNEDGQTRTVISTLDDIQYPGYYSLRANETISLVDSWMCWGRHGEYQKPCANPRTVPSTRSAPEATQSQP